MKRRSITIIAALILALAVASLAFAEANARKGKFLYRSKCRTCHGAAASDLSPNSKTQADWKKTFAKVESIKCYKDWKGVSAEDRADIFAYLHDYAKDSPSPAKCN
ncbi:MAG: cytochrome C [Desulfovibrionales bacterium GWA2_65_9]|nr:MAG: cytochrome C [Desulfovibrionales bacterium GWA2_65_9]